MADDDESGGASPWEQLLYAAKTDALELAEASLSNPKLGDDVNKQDGLGMTALHHATKAPSPDVLEALLEHEGTDVDLQDKLDGDTPLHVAVKLDNEEARIWVVRTLLESGADPKIRNKHKQLAVDLLPPKHELREDFRKAEAESAIDSSDLVNDDSDVDGEEGGNSGEE